MNFSSQEKTIQYIAYCHDMINELQNRKLILKKSKSLDSDSIFEIENKLDGQIAEYYNSIIQFPIFLEQNDKNRETECSIYSIEHFTKETYSKFLKHIS